MSAPLECRTDDAGEVVNAFIRALKMAFDPDTCPPDGGGSKDVRFFAGEGIPMEVWDAHNEGDGCDHPFLWVRVLRRFRSQEFPSPALSVEACNLPRVLAVEVGVGRCAVVDQQPSWEDYAREAEISLDDSWRVEEALCVAAGILRGDSHQVAIDTVAPYGPEGGVIAWTGVAYVTF